MVTLRPDRRFAWSVGAHRRSRYFATGHAAMDVVIAELCSLAGGAAPRPPTMRRDAGARGPCRSQHRQPEHRPLRYRHDHAAPRAATRSPRSISTPSTSRRPCRPRSDVRTSPTPPSRSEQVARHAELVRWADTLVFVYPTWWAGPPAASRAGWSGCSCPASRSTSTERRTRSSPTCATSAPGRRHHAPTGPRGGAVRLVHDSGRRTSCGRCACCARRRCRTRWLALYSAGHRRPRPGGRPSGPGSSNGSHGCERPAVNVLAGLGPPAWPTATPPPCGPRRSAASRPRDTTSTWLDLDAEGFDSLAREECDGHAGPARAHRLPSRTAPTTSPPTPPGCAGADALVLVYPTWWGAQPAILKGWLDRVWVDGVAFTRRPSGAPDPTRAAQHPPPGRDHDARLVEVDQRRGGRAGQAPGAAAAASGCHPRVRTRWIALYGMDRLRRGRPAPASSTTGRAGDGRARNGSRVARGRLRPAGAAPRS